MQKELVLLVFVSFHFLCLGKAVIEEFPNRYGGYEYTYDFKTNKHKYRPLIDESHNVPSTEAYELSKYLDSQANPYAPPKLTSSIEAPTYDSEDGYDTDYHQPVKSKTPKPGKVEKNQGYYISPQDEESVIIVKKVKHKPKIKQTIKPKVESQKEKVYQMCDKDKLDCSTSDYVNSDPYIKVVERPKHGEQAPTKKLKVKQGSSKVTHSSLTEYADRPVPRTQKVSPKPQIVKEKEPIPEKQNCKSKETEKVGQEAVDYYDDSEDDCEDLETVGDVVGIKQVKEPSKEKVKPKVTPKPKDSYYDDDDDDVVVIKTKKEPSKHKPKATSKPKDSYDEDYEDVVVIKKEQSKHKPKATSKPQDSYDDYEDVVVIKKEKEQSKHKPKTTSKPKDSYDEDYEDVVVIKKPSKHKPKATPKPKDSYDDYEDVVVIKKEQSKHKPKVTPKPKDSYDEDYEDVVVVKTIKEPSKEKTCVAGKTKDGICIDKSEQKEPKPEKVKPAVAPKPKDSYSDIDEENYNDVEEQKKSDHSSKDKTKTHNPERTDPNSSWTPEKGYQGDVDDLNYDKDTEINPRTRLPFQSSNLWSAVFNPGVKEKRLKPCFTRTNETGICMYVNQCQVPNIASSLEQLLNNACVVDDVFIGVCCPDFPVETVKVQWEDIEKNAVDKEDEFDDKARDCGTRSKEASRNKLWPWKAQLVSMSNGRIFCGGVIIHNEFILTAAHCTTKIPRNQILVRLGPQSETSEDFAVTEIKRHAQYNSRNLHNDIALLKLGHRIHTTDDVNLVCLPDDDDDDDYSDDEAILLGWQGKFGDNQKSEELEIMSNSECRDKMKANVPQSMLCTEARNEDEITCNADSGAPLIIEDDNRYKVIGILSWNRNDCDKRFPSVFSRVSSYVKWIRRHAV